MKFFVLITVKYKHDFRLFMIWVVKSGEKHGSEMLVDLESKEVIWKS